MSSDDALILLEPDPQNPGWLRYELSLVERYNRGVLGTLLVRREDDKTCRVRLTPRELHLNSTGRIHGGIVLGLIDVSLFMPMLMICDVPVSGSVTLDMQTQFIGPGDGARPLDAVVELVKETGRLGFLRGLVMQDDDIVASFTATIRKPSRTP